MLPWAKVPVLSVVHTYNKQTFKAKQPFNIFQATTTPKKPYKYERKPKQVEY